MTIVRCLDQRDCFALSFGVLVKVQALEIHGYSVYGLFRIFKARDDENED